MLFKSNPLHLMWLTSLNENIHDYVDRKLIIDSVVLFKKKKKQNKTNFPYYNGGT